MTAIASPIITQMEQAYADVRANHPDLPADIVFVMGQGATRSGIKYGHFATGRWTAKDAVRSGEVPEVLISAECLAMGAEQVMQTIVHEAVHALAHARGVKETSRQNRYHNRKFVDLAEELGMFYPHDGPDATIGWSAVELTEETKAKYSERISLLEEAITVAKDAGLDLDTEPEPRKPRYVMCVVFEDGTEVELPVKKYEQLELYLQPHTAHEEER